MPRKRNIRIHIYLDQKEYDQLMKKVGKTNLSREQFIRAALEGKEVREAPPADFREASRLYRNIGNYLQELALRGRSDPNLRQHILACLEDIYATNRILTEQFVGPRRESPNSGGDKNE